MADIQAQVKTWLTDNGQVLELQVARDLLSCGLPVEQSVMYRDGIEGKTREADIVVDLSDPKTCTGSRTNPLIVTIECKHTTKGPWAGIIHQAPPQRDDIPPSVALAYGNDAAVIKDLEYATLQITHPPCGGIYLTAGQNRDRNTAYDATRQALAAARAVGRARLTVETDPASLQDQPRGGAVSLVVTTAPLFRAQLDHGGEIQLQPTDELDVMTDSSDGSHLVTVVTRAGLRQWASKLGQHWAPARV